MMSWRDYLSKSPQAIQLESSLKPNVVEHTGGLTSTANTDVEKKEINLDVSQPPLKCALSFAYELKNLENAKKYELLNEKAKKGKITKGSYIKEMIQLEAEAAYFRCQVFYSLGAKENDFPCNKKYLELYESTKNTPITEAINIFALHIQEYGIVKREYSAKKYYADCFDFYKGRKEWPKFYDKPRINPVIIANCDIDKKMKP